MKAIVVTTKGEVYRVHLGKPLYRSAGAVLGGHFEVVRPRNLRRPYCMLVNESGILKQLPYNAVGNYLYGTQIHGHPIVGNIIIMKEEQFDLMGLKEIELKNIEKTMKDMVCILREDLYGSEE